MKNNGIRPLLTLHRHQATETAAPPSETCRYSKIQKHSPASGAPCAVNYPEKRYIIADSSNRLSQSLTSRLPTPKNILMKTNEQKSSSIGNRLAISAIYLIGLAFIFLQIRSQI